MAVLAMIQAVRRPLVLGKAEALLALHDLADCVDA
jgi:hypothetical protein